jgi:CheY-like chemotaxis protein
VTQQVLLVEDEPTTQAIVAAALAAAPRVRESDAPLAARIVGTLAEARTALAAGGVAAVLLDLSLPDSEGLDTVRAVHAVAPAVPIVVLTATDDEALALTAVREGAQDWVVKASADPALIPRVVRHAIERRRADVQLAESMEALHRARQLASVGRLAGGMAHAFNNMLTVIRCSAELLRDQVGDEGQRRDVEGMLDAAQRASALVTQLLAFGSRQVLRPVPTDLAGLVHEAMPVLSRAVGKAATLDLVTATGLPPVRIDPGQVEQVLAQLVLDARDVQPPGGTIRITVEAVRLDAPLAHVHGVLAPGQWVVLGVQDQAPLAPDAVAHLFEPFVARSGGAQGSALDASLGLAVAYGIVRQSGGQLRVQTDGATSTTLEVWLPATATVPGPNEDGGVAGDATDAPGTALPEVVPFTAGEAAGHDQRILVVDDDPRIRELVVRVLRGQGWTVRAAGGGDEALRVLADCDGAVDLVVTDISMPGMDGKTLVDRVRATWPAMRVLFMSGYADEQETREAMGGAVAFLSKPFTSVDLSRAVREAWLADPAPWPPG